MIHPSRAPPCPAARRAPVQQSRRNGSFPTRYHCRCTATLTINPLSALSAGNVLPGTTRGLSHALRLVMDSMYLSGILAYITTHSRCCKHASLHLIRLPCPSSNTIGDAGCFEGSTRRLVPLMSCTNRRTFCSRHCFKTFRSSRSTCMRSGEVRQSSVG